MVKEEQAMQILQWPKDKSQRQTIVKEEQAMEILQWPKDKSQRDKR